MKVTTAAILSTAFASTVVALNEPTFQFRISSSQNPAINGSFVTLKDDASSSSSEPNPIGIWLSDGAERTPYQATPRKTQDSHIFELWRADGQTKLTLYGVPEAMNLVDVSNPSGIKVAEGLSLVYTKWLIALGTRATLRYAQDYKDSNPTGGAGSWRACKSETSNDYQLYWYDGSSPLPYKNCEGVTLDIVTIDKSSTRPTASATASATTSGSATGVTLTGVTAPTDTSATFLTGVTAPTSTNKASSNSTGSSASPTATSFQGAAPKSLKAPGLAVVAFGAFAFML